MRESIADALTEALNPDDAQISKFHGFYEQDDRDLRRDREQRLLEPDYRFMLRARLPGDVCTPAQWLVIDKIGRTLGNGSVRLTTRQTSQYHGILKRNLKPLIQSINRALIDSIGGCGDVNRNVMSNPNPVHSELHAQVHAWARRISEHLMPKTRAYHEIWLDEEQVAGSESSEPLYGNSYLPRKFKTAVAIPPHNDVDVYTNDLGFIAIADDAGELLGFNVTAGGGMGTTHGDSSTFPRLADTLGFIEPPEVLAVAEAVLSIQRDQGDRLSNLRLQSIACVALPTCPQAMAEAERYFPAFVDKVEAIATAHGLGELGLVMRMTGCPNGCARPFVAEVGLVGKGPGRYNLMLGGDGRGKRLNKLYRENLDEQGILQTLDALFARFAAEHEEGERLGDFVIRAGIVKAVHNAAEDFHD